ncbi:hypothetical protein KC678_04935 [Candidatus Dojkabacteria bacterium]|uniref:Uncharacterized protein n=1 Tax=Candidatus Dojkabacteria bacterium TaxID=2099670 RepID=A0A955RHP5_9BACT|nr:hypothetical protein [Candidatus Dojkabacteria bacterium]
MRKLKIFLQIIISAVVFGSFTTKVNAQYGVCDFFPCGNGSVLPTPDNPISTIELFVGLGVSLIFTGFIAFGIFIIIKSALKIIQSEGDEAKVEESAGAIKSVFIGLGMLIMGIIGIVVLLSLFRAGGLISNEPQTPEGVNELPFINN